MSLRLRSFSCFPSALIKLIIFILLTSARAFIFPTAHQQPRQHRSRHKIQLFSVKPQVLGVTLKLAVDSRWGAADQAATISERFTSEQSLDLVHRLRRYSDAVLVGKGTVQEDDPSLTVRRVRSDFQPTRIVLDSNLSLDAQKHKLFTDGLSTIIYHAETVDEKDPTLFASPQVTCEGVPISNSGGLDLGAVMDNIISKHGLQHVMVEGGPSVAIKFLEQGLVDRVVLIRALDVKFRDPYPSNLSAKKLLEYGLELLGEFESGGGDVVQCWSRPNTPWPTQNLTHWP